MFVFRNPTTGKFIGIDESSGGYPYESDLTSANIFASKDKAYSYKQVCDKNHTWELCHVYVEAVKDN